MGKREVPKVLYVDFEINGLEFIKKSIMEAFLP